LRLRYRISAAAEADIAEILAWTQEHFGASFENRVGSLVRCSAAAAAPLRGVALGQPATLVAGAACYVVALGVATRGLRVF